nr:regulator of G-protein signaling 20 isoform X2 [Pelodiscus sinensis]XP_025044369.1 regulator of G-protein signaling 20 isoform X2 [Pelodiscus sinensis]|eukprot:XP_014432945.2 regulator of G-protein signaling 20 isoform X2 [Pelodiscus sinensis]
MVVFSTDSHRLPSPWDQSGWRCANGRCLWPRRHRVPHRHSMALGIELPMPAASVGAVVAVAHDLQGDLHRLETNALERKRLELIQIVKLELRYAPEVQKEVSKSNSLTVRNQDEERERRTSHELRAESIPNCEESPTPTLEEVNAWAQSFDKLMITPAGRNAFREFLRTEFSEENMLFWMACEELKQESNKSVIEEKARLIYEDYISILSPKEVSLDSRVREVINRNMLEPSQHTFDDAQLQIYTLMHRDSYPRFMNSAIYKDLLQSLSEKSIKA